MCANERQAGICASPKRKNTPRLAATSKSYLGDEKHSMQQTNVCSALSTSCRPGMREPLYFKDDDERLSFLFGNYITLDKPDRPRDCTASSSMHISAQSFVSVHTTNPAAAGDGCWPTSAAGEVLDYLPRLAAGGIELNCQLVLCRGVNDGDELRRTLTRPGLALRPQVGQHRRRASRRDRLPRGSVQADSPTIRQTAAATLDILEEFAQKCRAEYGRSVIYPSDEWYLTAERPAASGRSSTTRSRSWRTASACGGSTTTTFLEELENYTGLVMPHSLDVVTGTLAGPLIRGLRQMR